MEGYGKYLGLLLFYHSMGVGTGSGISLRFDNWLGPGVLRSLISSPLNQGEELLT